MIPKIQDDSEPLSKERLRLWLKLIKSHSAIEMELRRRLREEFATTLPRFDVMSALARAPQGLKMSEISGSLKVSNGNVTGIVDRLADDGLALREAVPGDRRAQRVRLTGKGQAAFTELASAHEQWIDELLGGLNREQVSDMRLLIEQLTHPLQHRGVASDAP